MAGVIPNPVAIVVGDVLGGYYYNHRVIESLFIEKGAPGDPPEGNCVEKITNWLKRASSDPKTDPLGLLGGVLEEFMEVDLARGTRSDDEHAKQRKRVHDVLARHGLSYAIGGRITGGAGAPSRSLGTILRDRDMTEVNREFDRALANVEVDPPAAITAACSILESLFKVYIEDEGLPMPKDQSIKPLWKTVQGHLGLDPAAMEDDDLKRILSGMTSVIDGMGAFRTHVSSAHGRGRASYKAVGRHARLALHASHSVAAFVIETWDERKGKE